MAMSRFSRMAALAAGAALLLGSVQLVAPAPCAQCHGAVLIHDGHDGKAAGAWHITVQVSAHDYVNFYEPGGVPFTFADRDSCDAFLRGDETFTKDLGEYAVEEVQEHGPGTTIEVFCDDAPY